MKVGLVLGGGGVAGAAWLVGALVALERETGWKAGTADRIVGTSAGSVLAASLGCGLGVDELLGHQRGLPVPGIEYDHSSAGNGMPGSPSNFAGE